jgi:hypothetical protein
MTNNEFKAWFEGFTEAMDKAPTQKQWSRIKEKVKSIDGTLSFTQYITRYVDRYPYAYPYYMGQVTSGYAQVVPMNANTTTVNDYSLMNTETTTTAAMNAAQAIADIGRKEFAQSC